jgi:hypothetical protein
LLFCPIMLCMPAFSSQAGGIYSYINKSIGTTEKATYEYTIEAWDEDIDIPNPCYRNVYCEVGISHRHNDKGEPGPRSVEVYRLPLASQWKTVGELGKEYKTYRPLPYSGVLWHESGWGDKLTTECVAIYYSVNLGPRTMMPGSICGVAPPPAGICGFTNMANITLDHGPVSASSRHDPISVNIGVSCSQSSKLKLYVKTAYNGRLDLRGPGSGVYSILRLNGVLADQGLDLPAVGPAGVNISLSSTLFTNSSSAAGNYEGSAIVILAVP